MSKHDREKELDSTVSEVLRDTMILDNIRDAVVVVDSDGKISVWNPGAESLFGWSRAEMIGQPHPVRFPHAAHSHEHASLCAPLRDNDWEGEYQDHRKDGTQIWVEARIRRLIDRAGRCIGVIGIFHDISLRKRIESDAKEREEFVRSVLDSMAPRIAVLDQQGNIVSINRAWREFGIRTTSPALHVHQPVEIGCNYLALCRSVTGTEREEAFRFAQGIEDVLLGKRASFELEYACDLPWAPRYCLMTVTPLGSHGKGVVVSHTDITQRRKIEASLKEHRDRLQLALSAAKMAVCTRDLQTGQITWSKEALELFPSLSLGSDRQRIYEVIHSEDLPKLLTTVQQALQHGTPQSCELRMIGDDHRIRRMSFLGQLCTDAEGRPVSLVGTLRDVTVQRRSELLLLGQNRILDLIAKGAPLAEVLREVVGLVESLLHCVICTILTKDAEGRHLNLVAAPSMPASYSKAVERIPIGPQQGSCGTCAFLGVRVDVKDIATDPLWDRYRHLALPIGLRSCLSVPIVASDAHAQAGTGSVSPRSVIGTFALYRTSGTNIEQDEEEDAVLPIAAQLAGVAIERDLAMRRITESEERYRRLLEVVPAAIVVIVEGRITFCNQTLLQVAGYQHRSELIGQDVRMLVMPAQHSELERTMSALLEGRIQQSSDDDYLVRSDDTLVPVQSVATMIWDGGRRAIMVALLDRTEQRRSDELLRSIMSSVTDAIITTDASGQIVSANAATARLFEYEVGELIGQRIRGHILRRCVAVQKLWPEVMGKFRAHAGCGVGMHTLHAERRAQSAQRDRACGTDRQYESYFMTNI